MSSGVTQNQSSPGVLEDPSKGAPKAVAPNPADYQVPGADALQQNIDQLAAQPLERVDDTAFNAQRQQENADLAHLDDIASGRVKTDAQVQGEQQLATAQQEAQGSTEAVRGVNPMLAVREEQQAQATSQMQARARIAQTSIQQMQAARTQATSLLGNMQRESQAQAELHQRADEANAQHETQILGERMSLSAMRQTASVSFAAAQNAYQTQQRQEHIINNQRHQEGMTRMIGGIIETAGAAVAIAGLWVADVFSLGIGTAGAAVGTAALAGVAAKGVADIQGGKSEADANPEG